MGNGAAGLPLRKRVLLIGVKTVHSVIFLSLQSAIVYLIYKGLVRQSDRRAAIAATAVTAECVIYAANGLRCPLTTLAEDLGAEHGAVTDIFLPTWLASNIARIYTPLFAFGLGLHARNLLANRPSI
jgi:hypothetical protein